jgi:OmpA-OmpF porin, OOP family
MKRVIFLSVFLLLTFLQGVEAQKGGHLSTKNKKAIKHYDYAELLIIRRQFYDAIDHLDKALKKDNKFVEAHLRLGSIYSTLNMPEKAYLHYEVVAQLQPDEKKYAPVYQHLADLSMSFGKYEKASFYASKYIELLPHGKEKDNLEELIKNADYAKEKIKQPLPFYPQPLPDQVNRFELQYFPVLTVDQKSLIFTRREGMAAHFDEDIFISHKDKNGEWGIPESISDEINTSYNEGTCTISADGRMLIFTSCLGRKGYGSCDLYVTYKTGDKWSEPQNLGPKVNSAYWESQPALSADGRTLYFVSDRRGGQGKRDIWVSYRDHKGEWTEAENLGPEVNSKDDDVSPFIHVNGQTLFFSSKRYPSFGGFDLFYTEKTDKGWTKPENLGYPINTSDDQVSLFITADGKKGYYSHEKRMDNSYVSKIYEFDVPKEIQVSHKSNYVTGRVYDKETKKLLKAQVELYDLSSDKLKSSVFSDSVSGEYLMVLNQGAEYALYVNKRGYLFEGLFFNYMETSSFEPVVIDVYLKPIKQGSKTTLKNIFFDTDKFDLQDKSKTELAKVIKFLKANPDVRIEVSGHTDDVGSKEYNNKLSLNRAKAVYDHLIKAGVPQNRLEYKGYGQDKPEYPNDTEENRKKNRRIEFRII